MAWETPLVKVTENGLRLPVVGSEMVAVPVKGIEVPPTGTLVTGTPIESSAVRMMVNCVPAVFEVVAG